jgi:glucokinase
MHEPRSADRHGHTIGIDVGGTKTKACLVRCSDGAVLAERIEATPCAEGGKAVLELVRALAADMHDQAKSLAGGGIAGLGVCIPELVTNDGKPASDWNFDWRDLDFRTPLAAYGPLHLESDVRAAAFAEAWIGAGRGSDVLLYVTISTGLSHTLVLGGRPYAGARGFAIHFSGSDLVTFGTGGPVRHNLEMFASGKALGERYGALTGSPHTTARDLFAAEDKDPLAAKMIGEALLSLASYVGQLVNILDPDRVVIGGGIGGDPAVNRRLADLIRQFIWADAARGLPIVAGALGGNACSIGVAAMAHRDAVGW